MQMLFTKLIIKAVLNIILLISCVSTCLADTEFNEYFQLQPTIDNTLANRITTYYSENIKLTAEQQKTELLKLQQNLQSISNQHKQQAVYWFIKGLNHRNLAAVYSELKNLPMAKSQTNNKNIAYKKALQLDSKPPHKLSAVIYSTMKYGLPENLKIKATQSEISLGGKGDNDSYYWYLHWSNIDQLQKAGRTEEAKEAYKKMQHELKNSDMDMSVYKKMNQQIEEKTLKNNIQQKPVRKPEKIEKETSPSKPAIDKKYIAIYAISILSALAIIAVTVYEIKKKKK